MGCVPICLWLLSFNPAIACGVSVYEPFISLVQFVPKYFILLDATVNSIAFLIPLSTLQVYGNTIGILILIVYPTTLPNC